MLTLLLGKQRNLILRRLALFTKYIYFKEENNLTVNLATEGNQC
jgi:hypothetical protein